MADRWRRLALLVLLVPAPVMAQRGWDVQGHAMALVGDSTILGGGLGGGLRLGRSLRLAGTGTAGWLAPDQAVGRGELMVSYHLAPTRGERPGLYAGGGVAAEARPDDLRGLVLLVLGVEARPWAGGGWFAEVGVGGGVRLALGYRRIRLARRGR